ncbi:MAG TPA: polyphosphate polymerase domain-containing protein [Bacteroidia bacterium]|nr:polyphosphate polymerase domain-containing protein [Bacteroidia bacterium]
MNSAALRNILNQFDPISLEEMDRVLLMDRTDLKFNFHDSRLPELLDRVKDAYLALDVADTRMTRYETLYYDTEDFSFYSEHHNEHANRYKIRLRRYVESDTNFFEIKFKNNKGRTIKTRVLRKDRHHDIEENSEKLLRDITPIEAGSLRPKLWVNYNRITLVNKTEEERVTVDFNMEMRMNENTVDFPSLVIVEVKQVRPRETALVRALRKMHIHEGGTSKYCIAVSKLVSDIKKNNFKPDLITIKKIINDNPAA